MKLSELKAVAEKATPGEWFVAKMPWDDRATAIYGNRTLAVGPSNDPHGARLISDCDVTMEWIEGEPDGSIEDRANAQFIAAARNHMSELIERVEKLSEALNNIPSKLLTGIPYGPERGPIIDSVNDCIFECLSQFGAEVELK